MRTERDETDGKGRDVTEEERAMERAGIAAIRAVNSVFVFICLFYWYGLLIRSLVRGKRKGKELQLAIGGKGYLRGRQKHKRTNETLTRRPR